MGYLRKEEHIKVDRSGTRVKLIRSGDVAKVPHHPKIDAKVKKYYEKEQKAKTKRRAERAKRWKARLEGASRNISQMEKNLESIGSMDFGMDLDFGYGKKRKRK